MPQKEDIAIVFDIGKGMSSTKTQEGILLLEPARKAVSILISQKILFSRGNSTGRILSSLRPITNDAHHKLIIF